MSFGPTFGDEIILAGLGGLPLVWTIGGVDIAGRETLTQEQSDILDGVVSQHDPQRAEAPEVLPPRMFYNALAAKGYITEQEALAAVSEKTVPAILASAVDALPPETAYQVNMILTGAINLPRFPPLSDVVKSAFTLDDNGVYDLWAVGWGLG